MNSGFDGLFSDHFGHSGTVANNFAALRQGAMTRFRSGVLPTRKQENWRYTSVKELLTQSYALQQAGDTRKVERLIAPVDLNDEMRIVLVNGQYQPWLTRQRAGAQDIKVEDLREAVTRGDKQVAAWLEPAALQQDGEALFADLSRAFLRDGIVVRVSPGGGMAGILHIIHVHTAGSGVQFVPLTQLIEIGEGAQLTLVESLVAEPQSSCFTHVSTKIVVKEGAHFHGHVIHEPCFNTSHILDYELTLERDVNATFYQFSPGARLYRSATKVNITGEGAHIELAGLNVLSGDAHIDCHVEMKHSAAHAVSRQLFKNILQGCARAAFTGQIRVGHDAHQSDAHQLTRTLLLDPRATSSAEPQLYIDADDVKCSHGATTGRLQADQLFYLHSRGIDKQSAELMLCKAFAGETLAGVSSPAIRGRISELINKRLAPV